MQAGIKWIMRKPQKVFLPEIPQNNLFQLNFKLPEHPMPVFKCHINQKEVMK